MKDELLNLIPDDILNLIYGKIKPSVKYCLNKNYFKKFYCYRFTLVNSKYIINNYLHGSRFFLIRNFNYIKYLIMKDCKMMIENLIIYKTKYDMSNYIFNNKINFENLKFKNLIDFCYYYSKYYNSNNTLKFLLEFIRKYQLSKLIKKEHKNNIKNNTNKWNY